MSWNLILSIIPFLFIIAVKKKTVAILLIFIKIAELRVEWIYDWASCNTSFKSILTRYWSHLRTEMFFKFFLNVFFFNSSYEFQILYYTWCLALRNLYFSTGSSNRPYLFAYWLFSQVRIFWNIFWSYFEGK